MSGQAENLAIECEETENLFQPDVTGVTHDTRYDAWEFGGCSGCQGAVQEIELVPKTEVGADPKLKRGERPLQANRRKQFDSGAGSGPDSSWQLEKFRFRNRVLAGVRSGRRSGTISRL